MSSGADLARRQRGVNGGGGGGMVELKLNRKKRTNCIPTPLTPPPPPPLIRRWSLYGIIINPVDQIVFPSISRSGKLRKRQISAGPGFFRMVGHSDPTLQRPSAVENLIYTNTRSTLGPQRPMSAEVMKNNGQPQSNVI